MSPPRVLLQRLSVRSLRNLTHLDLEPAARVNVVAGNNGQGKTSLLEAIYLACTSRSFRTARPPELVQHGAAAASARARFVDQDDDALHAPLAREQVVAIEGRRVQVRLDGNRPASLADFATRSPVVAFHPDELTLSTGPAQGRRTLLDRLALFMAPASADHRARYQRALRSRHLGLRRPSVDPAEIEAYERIAAHHGAALTRARALAADALTRELLPAFARIAAPGLDLSARYAPGGSDDPAHALDELARHRDRDAHRPTAGFGPHRDDLVLELGGHSARAVASQGQHRALTLALKAAETATVAAARGVEPLLLLDDVSSELDPDRTEALFTFLGLTRGQLFLTTTRRELIVTPGIDAADRRDFEVRDGVLRALD